MYILFISPLQRNNIVATILKAYNDYNIITSSNLNKIEASLVQTKMQKSILILRYQTSVEFPVNLQ